MIFEPEKTLDDYLSDDWVLQNVSTTPERTQKILGLLSVQHKQYGLKNCVTATIYASMGDTLPKVALEISQTHSSFKLWGKEQVIVALSQQRKLKILSLLKTKQKQSMH